MVAPVTGPFSTIETVKSPFQSGGFNVNSIYKKRVWNRQKRPYTLPLSFAFVDYRVLAYETNEPGSWYATYSDTYYDLDLDQNAYNKAYGKFKSNLGESASLSVSLAERKQAMDMISKRSVQLLSFVNDLRKLNFASAAKTLGIAQPPVQQARYRKGRKQPWEYPVLDETGGSLKERGKRFYLPLPSKGERQRAAKRAGKGLIPEKSHKAFANNYLEFHFGWSPLIKDIGSAVEVLQGGVPPCFVRGSATTVREFVPTKTDTEMYSHRKQQTVTLRAQVRITNQDLWLANQLGFVNPLTVAWELVPYSFVVDWFVNVGEYLNSFTDFVGIELINPSRTVFTRDVVLYRYYIKYTSGSSAGTTVLKNGKYQGIYVERTPGSFSGPVLKVRPPWVVSPRRGFAAISLLIQKLK